MSDIAGIIDAARAVLDAQAEGERATTWASVHAALKVNNDNAPVLAAFAISTELLLRDAYRKACKDVDAAPGDRFAIGWRNAYGAMLTELGFGLEEP